MSVMWCNESLVLGVIQCDSHRTCSVSDGFTAALAPGVRIHHPDLRGSGGETLLPHDGHQHQLRDTWVHVVRARGATRALRWAHVFIRGVWQGQGELEGGRNYVFLALEASFLLSAWQITSGKSFGLETLLLLSAVTFWNVHVQYFAQNNLNMKCQFYAKASLSLLLILHGQGHMWVYPQHPGHQPQSRRSLEVVYYCSFVFGTFSPDAHWRMSRWKIKSWRLSKKTIEQLLISL